MAAVLLSGRDASRASAQPGTGAPAATDGITEARRHFEIGVEHFQAERYPEALGNFEQAYRLKPHPLVRVNIANCYDRLGRPVEAIEHFEAFLASSEGSASQRTEVQQAVARLSKQLGRLVLHLEPPPIEARLDGPTELRRIAHWVMPGQHHLRLGAEGYESTTRMFAILPGEVVDLSVALKPLARPASTQAAPTRRAARVASGTPPNSDATPKAVALSAQPPAGSAPLRDSTSLWITGGSTLLLGIGAVITGQLALDANRQFDTDLHAVRNPMLTEFQRAAAWGRGVDASGRAETMAAVTDVLLGLTLISAGLTVHLYLAGRASAAAEAPAQSAFRAEFAPGQAHVRAQF